MFQLLLNGFVDGLLYAPVALGFHLIYRGTKILHIAHGAIYTATAYSLIAWAVAFNINLSAPLDLRIVLPIVLALLTGSFIALLSEGVVYYPLFLRNVSPLTNFISSLGVYIVIVSVIAMAFGNEPRLPVPNADSQVVTFLSISIGRMQFVKFAISSILIFAVLLCLSYTRIGRSLRALSDNATLTSLLGNNVKTIRLLVFIVGSVLASASALMQVLDFGINPQAGLPVALNAAVAVIIGGKDSPLGAVLGALSLGISRALVIYFVSSEWQDAVPIAVFVIFLFVHRGGFVEKQLRLEEG